jgi:hypothetical protein
LIVILILILILIQAPKYGLLIQSYETTYLNTFIQRSYLSADVIFEAINAIIDLMDVIVVCFRFTWDLILVIVSACFLDSTF